MSNRNSNTLLLVGVLVLLSCSPPSFGIGEPPGISKMIEESQIICCGTITGCKITQKDQIRGTNHLGNVVFEFAIDHMIKGNVNTNRILVLCKEMEVSEEVENKIKSANSGLASRLGKQRIMLFLLVEDDVRNIFRRLPALNAELPLSAIPPNKSGKESGIEEHIETELIEAMSTARDETKKYMQTLLETWRTERLRGGREKRHNEVPSQ